PRGWRGHRRAALRAPLQCVWTRGGCHSDRCHGPSATCRTRPQQGLGAQHRRHLATAALRLSPALTEGRPYRRLAHRSQQCALCEPPPGVHRLEVDPLISEGLRRRNAPSDARAHRSVLCNRPRSTRAATRQLRCDASDLSTKYPRQATGLLRAFFRLDSKSIRRWQEQGFRNSAPNRGREGVLRRAAHRTGSAATERTVTGLGSLYGGLLLSQEKLSDNLDGHVFQEDEIGL